MEKKKINTNAIFACIFSIIAWFIFSWLAYAGIACGIGALKEIKQKGERGKVLAIIGIVLGIVEEVIMSYARIMRL